MKDVFNATDDACFALNDNISDSFKDHVSNKTIENQDNTLDFSSQNEGSKNQSIVKWQTGNPEASGLYLVSLKNGSVNVNVWVEEINGWWEHVDSVIAWCAINTIVNYKKD